MVEHHPLVEGVDEAVAVGDGVIAVVLPRQGAGHLGIQGLHAVAVVALLADIDGHAHQMAGRGLGVERLVHGWEEGELVARRPVHVEIELIPVRPGAHGVGGHPGGALDPLDVAAVAAPAHDPEIGGQGGVPGPVRAALVEQVLIGGERDGQEGDVLLGDPEVVDHAGVGGLDPGRPVHRAGLVAGEHLDIGRVEALGLIAEGDHLAGHRIELGVGGEGQRLHAAAEGVVVVGGLQRQGIHRHRRGVLLHREQLAVVIDDLGVGRAAAEPLDRGIVGGRIAVHAEQRTARLVLGFPALVPGIAGAVVDVAVLDAEHRDMAFPVEGDVHLVLVGLGVLGIGADPVEDAVQAVGQLALHLAVVEIDLRAVDGARRAAARAEGPAEAAAALGEQHLRLGLRRGGQAAGKHAGPESHAAQKRAPIHAAPVLVTHRALPAGAALLYGNLTIGYGHPRPGANAYLRPVSILRRVSRTAMAGRLAACSSRYRATAGL